MSNLLTSTSAAGPGGSKPGSGGGSSSGSTPAEDVGKLKSGPKSGGFSMGGNATLADLRGALARRKQVDYQGQHFTDAKTLFDISRINDISNKMSASDLTGGGNPALLARTDAAMSDGSTTGVDPSLLTQGGPAGSNSGGGSSSDAQVGGTVPSTTNKALTAAEAAAAAAEQKAAELEEYQKSKRAYKAAQESKTTALMQPIIEDPKFSEGWAPTMEEGQEVAASMVGWKALLIMLGTNEDKIRNSGEGAAKLLDQGKHVLALVNMIQNRDCSQKFWKYLTGKVAYREATYDAMGRVTQAAVYYNTVHNAAPALKQELVAKAIWYMQMVIRTPTKREENDLYQKQLAETKERKAKQESKLKQKMQKGRGRKEASSSRASSNARGRSTSAGPYKKGKREDGPSGQQKQQQKQDSGRKKGTKGKRYGTDSAEKNFATAAKKRSDGTEEEPIELEVDPVEGEAEEAGAWQTVKGKGRGKQGKG